MRICSLMLDKEVRNGISHMLELMKQVLRGANADAGFFSKTKLEQTRLIH